MAEWALIEGGADQDAVAEVAQLQEALAAERELRLMVTESYADLEALYRDNVGWKKLGDEGSQFTAEGRQRIAKLADLAATGNALIKTGLNLRIAYVWGGGVTVTVKDDGATGQDVNAVWQAFWNDRTNRRTFTTTEAQARYERRLGTTGEVFWALPTDRRTGRVRVRRIPAHQITERICDPEDAESVWLYKRVYAAVVRNPRDGSNTNEDRVEYYPALGFTPSVRASRWQGKPIRWDAPVRHVAVNVPDEDWRGIGDVVAAMPWARADKEFLEDLAKYMRALTKILGQVQAPNSRAAAAAQRAMAGTTTEPGAMLSTDASTSLSLVSKSGAQIDGDSHRPLATMVAAGLEVPLTMLLGDPGQTGARAVAETLDQPTELKFGLRRDVHTELLRDVANYVIDQAVIAPAGPLSGTAELRDDELVVTLPEGDDRTLDVSWPAYDSTPLDTLVGAIKTAAETEVLDPVEILRLLAAAFQLEDVEALVDAATDEQGRFIDRRASAAAAAVEAHRRGEDPARLLR